MADDGQLTPEKQLLRLIEEGKGAQPGSSVKQAKAKQAHVRLMSFTALRGMIAGRLSFFRRNAHQKLGQAARRKPSLALVNATLLVVMAGLFVYVVGDALASAVALQRPPALKPQKEPAASAAVERISPLKDSSYYIQKITSRDIFKTGAVKKEEKKQAAVSVQDNPVTSGLSLVGISWSQNPDVIIEDKSKQRTFFVKRGQIVGNGVKVEAIFKDHVVLSYDGQEFEL